MYKIKEYDLPGKINEECGVFGVYDVEDASSITYYGLHALQHRGQEAAGIASSDDVHIQCIKGKGLIQEVFTAETVKKLNGISAVGHVRYSSKGNNELENIQPLMVRAHTGHFAVVHNGQIVNAMELKIALENTGSIFQGTSDSEILVHLIQKHSGNMVAKITKACNMLEGAFTFIILTKDCMFAIRDKNGLRPLSLGKMKDGYCISSETCAFDVVGAQFIRDLKPGELLRIDHKEVQSFQYTTMTQKKMCAMEYVYFARPDSVIEGLNVHNARKKAGKLLAQIDGKEHDVSGDIVIGVPDSSLSAAIGYAEESKLPYEMGLIKNRYIARTFIQPTQAQRENGVRMKLSAVSSIVNGKRIILIDDSIVRGTTIKRIIKILKDAGAIEIHVRIASAPFVSPCFYGVDTSDYHELIAHKMSVEELKEYIQADSLKFITIEQMYEIHGKDLCLACFSKQYPTELFQHQKEIEE